MRGHTRVVVGAILTLGCSCVLFTDLNEFSSEENAKEEPDGSGGAQDANGGDVPDSAPFDAGSSSDADADASDGCLYCENFDDDGALVRSNLRIFDRFEPKPTIQLDPLSTSAPSSLRILADPVHYDGRAHLEQVVDVGEVKSVRCAFDLRIETIPLEGSYLIFSFGVVEGTGSQFANFAMGSNGRTELSKDGDDVFTEGPPLTAATWQRVILTLVRAPSPKLAVSIGAATASKDLAGWEVTPKLGIAAGLKWGNPYGSTPSLDMRIDTIRCEAL